MYEQDFLVVIDRTLTQAVPNDIISCVRPSPRTAHSCLSNLLQVHLLGGPKPLINLSAKECGQFPALKDTKKAKGLKYDIA